MDFASNVNTATVSFNIVVTYANLCTLTRQFLDTSNPDKRVLGESLCSKLGAAEAAAARGNANAKRNALDAYIRQLKATVPNFLTQAQVEILTPWRPHCKAQPGIHPTGAASRRCPATSCPARRPALCRLRTHMDKIDDASWHGLLRRGAPTISASSRWRWRRRLRAMTALAQPQGEERNQEPAWVFSSGASLALFPGGDVYPVYVADPHRPTNVVAEAFTIGGGMPATDSPLTRLGAGGRFGVIRIEPAKPDGRVWQVSIEAGFDAIFDSQNRLDVVGWDGNYGLMVTTASSSPIALKIAVLHISAT